MIVTTRSSELEMVFGVTFRFSLNLFLIVFICLYMLVCDYLSLCGFWLRLLEFGDRRVF